MTVATRKIFKTGNSLVIALPRDVLELLQLGEGAEVSVDLDPEQKQIVIVPAPTFQTEIDAEFARRWPTSSTPIARRWRPWPGELSDHRAGALSVQPSHRRDRRWKRRP